MMFAWYAWLGLGLVLFIFATFFTFIWWKIGDQWADAEYKKFGHGGGVPTDVSKATVISGFDAEDAVVVKHAERADDDSSAEKTG